MDKRKKVITTPYWWTRDAKLAADNGMGYLKGTEVVYTPGDVQAGELALLDDAQVRGGSVVRRVAAVKGDRFLLICPDGTEPPRWCKVHEELTPAGARRRFTLRGRFEAVQVYNAKASAWAGIANYNYVVAK